MLFSLKTMKNCKKTRAFESTIKPSLSSGMIPISQKLFYGKRTQFERPKSAASNYSKTVYNALLPKGNEPKRTQSKPILARNFFRKSPVFQKNLNMKSKPNFKNQENTATKGSSPFGHKKACFHAYFWKNCLGKISWRFKAILI